MTDDLPDEPRDDEFAPEITDNLEPLASFEGFRRNALLQEIVANCSSIAESETRTSELNCSITAFVSLVITGESVAHLK